MISKTTTLGIAGLSGLVAFIAYCVYFDHKRRSDPLFKRRLKEKRQKENERKVINISIQKPDLKNTQALQEFSEQELRLGEALEDNDVENGIEHLCIGITFSNNLVESLRDLEQKLVPHIYYQLLNKFPSIHQRLMDMYSADNQDPKPSLAEEEVD